MLSLSMKNNNNNERAEFLKAMHDLIMTYQHLSQSARYRNIDNSKYMFVHKPTLLPVINISNN